MSRIAPMIPDGRRLALRVPTVLSSAQETITETGGGVVTLPSGASVRPDSLTLAYFDRIVRSRSA